jgi:hypothetical protein
MQSLCLLLAFPRAREFIGYVAVFVAEFEVDDEEAAFVACIVNAIGAKRLRTKSAIVAELNRSFECGSCLQNDNLRTNCILVFAVIRFSIEARTEAAIVIFKKRGVKLD